MSPIKEVIINKKTSINPIWIMRQAGRYLPEFREIRKRNKDFIKLCLNPNLSSEITLQPLKRFDLDAAIIFSDILMLPYGLCQNVEFKKGLGPLLGHLNIDEMLKLKKDDFIKKVSPVYKAISLVKDNKLIKNKSVIGFVGAPWTLLVYMINKKSPKLNLKSNFFEDLSLLKETLGIINPHQYICTLLDDSELYLEIDIERGKGYRLSEENRKNKIEKKLSGTKPSTLFIDSIFMPVKNVNYKIKLINDSKGNIKESLNIEILTDGSITPKRSVQESLKILMKLFYPLFITQDFLAISSQISKKIYKEKLN